MSMVHSGTGTHYHSYKPAGISFTLVSFSGIKLLAVAHNLFVPSKLWQNKHNFLYIFLLLKTLRVKTENLCQCVSSLCQESVTLVALIAWTFWISIQNESISMKMFGVV